MSHIHTIEDHDKHFIIDSITKKIQPENHEKNKLVRYDHNSERYTFEMNRIVEGHDMSLCDIVQIHYINISSNKQTKNEDIYEVKDLGLIEDNEERIAFTWLISRNATSLDGTLTFAIRFACSDNDNITYELHTEIFSSISISNTIFNDGQAIAEEYSDILNQWKQELFAIEGIIQTAKNESLDAIDKLKTDTLKEISDNSSSSLQAIEKNSTDAMTSINISKLESIKEVTDEGVKQVENITEIIDGVAQESTASQILEKENKSIEFLKVIAEAAGKAGNLNGFGLEKGLNDSVVITYTDPDTGAIKGSSILPRDITLLKIKESLTSINKSLKLIALRNGVSV